MKMLMQQKIQLNTVTKGCCVIIAAAYIVIQGCFIWGVQIYVQVSTTHVQFLLTLVQKLMFY